MSPRTASTDSSAPDQSLTQRGILDHWQAALVRIKNGWRRLLLFQLWYGLIVGAILSVVAGWVVNRLIASAGSVAVTNFDLIAFFLSFTGLSSLALMVAIGSASYFLERCGIVILMAGPGDETSPLEALRYSLRRMWPLVQLGWWYALLLVATSLPFLLIGWIVAQQLIGAHDINYYLYHQPREWWVAIACGAVLGAVWGGLAFALMLRLTFAMQWVLLGGMPPRAALAKSWSMTRGRLTRLCLALGGWWLMVSLAAGLLSACILWVSTWSMDAAEASPYLALALVAGFGGLLTLANAAGHILCLSGETIVSNRLYGEYGGVNALTLNQLRAANPRRSASAWWITGLAGIGCVGALAFAGWRLTTALVKDDFTITAHRAGAARAPENTLAALRQAIEDHADLAEIDVQTTRDGQLVILHDGDLARIGSDPRRVADLTFDELRQIDVGRWHDAAFTGEHVATLAEMVNLARGRIRLNVELKYNRDDPALAGKVIDLLRSEGVLDQCVLTSLEYTAVREAKRLAPAAQVGLIVTKAIGDPTDVEADFLSLNQDAVSSALVRRAHARGKEVHVWTVNDRESMQRMIDIGVDSLITDYPGVAAELRQSRAALSTPELLVLWLRTILLGR